MKKFIIVLLCITGTAFSQDILTGVVLAKNDDGIFTPVIGASAYWLGTTIGRTTDTSGVFMVPVVPGSRRIVVSYLGYIPDTLTIKDEKKIHIILKTSATQVAEVEVVGEKQSTYVDYMSPQGTIVMTEKELFKAACCNLSESFETNPSIDVSFTDAITGTKQIEMLGLAGTYTQIMVENLPAVRGITSHVGLTYLPGTWIQSIQVSKGVGSVANGFESITGQINVELRKPPNEEEKLLFVNLFANSDQRFEANLNLRTQVSGSVTSMTMLHGSKGKKVIDGNGDRFLDVPLFQTVNAIQRFHFTNHQGLESQIGLQYVKDEKQGGTIHGYDLDRSVIHLYPSEYSYRMKGQQVRLWGKTGYVFSGKQYQSVGLQWSLTRNTQSSFFNHHGDEAEEKTGYLNLIYQSIIDNTMHKFRTGVSLLYDEIEETMVNVPSSRLENTPGAFFEYTFSPDDELSMIAGIRADRHSEYGVFFTPRLHLRYTPQEDWVLRLVGGRGERSANIQIENMAFLASARSPVIKNLPSGTSANSAELAREIAWNYGFNLTHYFLYDYREATITLDFYRTDFERQAVVDLDSNPRELAFYPLAGESYSNSFQAELNMQPFEKFDTRIAYRFLDVKQTIGGVLRDRPFVARHRAFINFAYATERDSPDESQMLYDLTVQWFGSKRIPDTDANPAGFQVKKNSPGFFFVNAQLTRSFFSGFDLYLGVENLMDFRQQDPILDAANPGGSYFDSSLIWGPVSGRTVYAGMRWRE